MTLGRTYIGTKCDGSPSILVGEIGPAVIRGIDLGQLR